MKINVDILGTKPIITGMTTIVCDNVKVTKVIACSSVAISVPAATSSFAKKSAT